MYAIYSGDYILKRILYRWAIRFEYAEKKNQTKKSEFEYGYKVAYQIYLLKLNSIHLYRIRIVQIKFEILNFSTF